MSKEKEIDHSGFQLEAPDVHNMILQQGANAFVKALNNMDINNDGKSDVAEIAPFVFGVLPELAHLAPLINVDKLKAYLKALPIFHDGQDALVEAAVEKIATQLIAAAEKFAPAISKS